MSMYDLEVGYPTYEEVCNATKYQILRWRNYLDSPVGPQEKYIWDCIIEKLQQIVREKKKENSVVSHYHKNDKTALEVINDESVWFNWPVLGLERDIPGNNFTKEKGFLFALGKKTRLYLGYHYEFKNNNTKYNYVDYESVDDLIKDGWAAPFYRRYYPSYGYEGYD